MHHSVRMKLLLIVTANNWESNTVNLRTQKVR